MPEWLKRTGIGALIGLIAGLVIAIGTNLDGFFLEIKFIPKGHMLSFAFKDTVNQNIGSLAVEIQVNLSLPGKLLRLSVHGKIIAL